MIEKDMDNISQDSEKKLYLYQQHLNVDGCLSVQKATFGVAIYEKANRASIGVECDAKPGTARRTAVPRSLGGENALSRKGRLCPRRTCPLLRTSQTSGAEYPSQVANAEDTSPLKIGTMWRPPSKLILRICGDFKQSVKATEV